MAPPVVVTEGDGTTGVAVAAAMGRGYSYSATENLLVSKAWYIAASEDPINKGSYQTVTTICDKMNANYLALCVEQTKLDYHDVMAWNAHRGSKLVAKPSPDTLERPSERPTNVYHKRSGPALWGQFNNKIAKECMAYGDIVATHPALPDEAESDSRARWMYLYKSRDDGTDFKYENCWEFLKDKPSWKVFLDNKAIPEISGRQKMGRPKGVKKAKMEQFIDATVERVIAAEKAKMADDATTNGAVAVLAATNDALLRCFNEHMASFLAIGQGVLMSVSSPETKARMKLEKDLELQARQVELDLKQVELQRAQTLVQKEEWELQKEQLARVIASKKAKLEHRRESILAQAAAATVASFDSGSVVPSALEYASDVEDLYE
jgi:hypothetical protein